MAATEPEFVGDGRRAVVDGLLRTYDLVRETGWPQWVMLEAPSGWGKTRIAREFYARLAAERQPEPAYWPAGILESLTEGTDTLSARRKRVFPHVVHEPGSLPAFMWWGIACSTRDGVPTVALAEDLDQLRAHGDYLEDAWRRAAPRGPRIAQSLSNLGAVAADELVMEGVGSAAEALLGAAVPGLGLVRWLGERTVGALRESGARRDRLQASEVISAKADLVDDTVAMISRLALPELPLVVFVEDLHDADASLSDLLAQLASRPGAVLIVTTSWPGSTAANPHVTAARDAAAERVLVLDHRGGRPPAPFPPDASLAPLTDEALAAIVRFRYPRVDAETLRSIIARYTNPLALELFCELPRVRRRVRDGQLALSATTIAESPAEIRGLYRELWNELPETVREALSLAALGAPHIISPSTSASTHFSPRLLAYALEAIDWPTADEIRAALDTDADAYSWVRTVSDLLRVFHEPDQLVVAADDDTFLVAEDRVEVRAALAVAVVALSGEESLAGDEALHLAEMALVLHAEGFLTDQEALARATLPALDVLLDQPRETRRVLSLADAVLAAAADGPAELAVRRRRATARLNLGDAVGAVEDSIHLLEHLAEDDPVRLGVRDDIGYALQEAGRIHDALDVFRTASADSAEHLGVDHPDTLPRRRAVALQLTVLGRLDEALQLTQAVLADCNRILGEEHPETLIALNNLAVVLENLDRLDEAIDAGARLCAARSRVLGPDHLMTLASRNNLASAMLRAGRIADARAASAQLVIDAERALGVDHPDVLTVRTLYGRCLLSGGEARAAADVHLGVWQERRRILGDDHPATLSARSCLAEDLYAMEQVPEATAHWDDLLLDRQRILGADHPDTLITRGFLAAAMLQRGEVDEALRVHDDLAADRERILGPRHVQTLAGRLQRARALEKAGRTSEAVAALEALAVDAVDALGPSSSVVRTARDELAHLLLEAEEYDRSATVAAHRLAETDDLDHPDALAVERTLVRALTGAERFDEAVDVARACARRHVDVCGPASAETVGARQDLVIALLGADAPQEAIAEMEAVATSEASSFGRRSTECVEARVLLAAVYSAAERPLSAVAVHRELLAELDAEADSDDPALLTARDSLAFALLAAGQPDEALAILQRVSDDSARLLGDDSPHTLASRANVAIALHAAGRTAQAQAQRVAVLADAVALLGEHDDLTRSIRDALAASDPAT